MGDAGGRDGHLAAADHALLVPEREGRLALEHDEHLLVRMAVQRGALTGIVVDDDHADACVQLVAGVLAEAMDERYRRFFLALMRNVASHWIFASASPNWL